MKRSKTDLEDHPLDLHQDVGKRARSGDEIDSNRPNSTVATVADTTSYPTVVPEPNSEAGTEDQTEVASTSSLTRNSGSTNNTTDGASEINSEPAEKDSSATIKPDPDAPAVSAADAAATPHIPTTDTSAIKTEAAVTIKTDPDAPNVPPIAANSASTSDNVKKEEEPAEIKPDPDAQTGPASASAPAVSAVAHLQPPSVPAAPSNIRVSCNYGIRCTRRNAQHRLDVAHPGEPDYRRPAFPPAPADAPECPFGSRCYRRNPAHFQRLQHPPPDVYIPNAAAGAPPPPQPQGRARRQRTARPGNAAFVADFSGDSDEPDIYDDLIGYSSEEDYDPDNDPDIDESDTEQMDSLFDDD